MQRLLRRVARTAWVARDRLSLDTWRAIYALTSADAPDEPAGAFDGTGALAYLDMLIRRTAALSGLADENMTRGNNWLFFDLGRRIERTLAACPFVRHTLTVADERESGAIQLALEIADSAMTYSYRYRNAFQAAPAVDLLLLDASNPRAVAFQIEAIVRHAFDLPMITEVQRRGRVKRARRGSPRSRSRPSTRTPWPSRTPTGRTRRVDRSARRRRERDATASPMRWAKRICSICCGFARELYRFASHDVSLSIGCGVLAPGGAPRAAHDGPPARARVRDRRVAGAGGAASRAPTISATRRATSSSTSRTTSWIFWPRAAWRSIRGPGVRAARQHALGSGPAPLRAPGSAPTVRGAAIHLRHAADGARRHGRRLCADEFSSRAAARCPMRARAQQPYPSDFTFDKEATDTRTTVQGRVRAARRRVSGSRPRRASPACARWGSPRATSAAIS